MAGTATPASIATSSFYNANNTITIEECIQLPCSVHSPGLWDYFRSGTLSFSLPLLELQMILIFAITQASHYILKPYGVPPFTSQFIAGIILGPSLLGRFKIFEDLFSIKSQEIIGVLASFGHTLFLFLSGVKMDMGVINRMGRRALCTGIASILSPLLISWILIEVTLRKSLLTKEEAHYFPYLISMHSLTSLPVVAYLLEHLKILNSELGQLGLSAALVSDMFSLFLMCLGKFVKIREEKGISTAIVDAVSSILFLFVVVFAFRPAMFWVARQTPEGRPVRGTFIHIIVLTMLCSGLLTRSQDLSFLLGPFILGLAVPDGPPLGSTIINKFNCFTRDVFHPLFVTTCVMRTDLRLTKFNGNLIRFNGILIAATFGAKMVGSLVPPLYSKMPLNDALALALILSSKGVVHLAFYTFFGVFWADNIADGSNAFSTIAILLNVIIVPILVKYLYDPSRKYVGYQKRNIMHCRRNEKLRILVCIRRPDNVSAVIKLLEASCSSRERAIAIYVLNLIELIGRASPIFISHQMHKKIVSKTSYSENVINAFNHFKRDNNGSVSLNVFTAITPSKFMPEDICTLALDKLTSLIVLPFHRKWSIDGSLESDDSTIRTLNCNVLEMAPCSVGILVDRGHLGNPMVSSESSYSIVMIFLGGNDDREALIFAKRVANNLKILLTVVHFVAFGNERVTQSDKLRDLEVLNEVTLNNVGDEYVIYKEEMVQDGPQTTLIVRSMVDEYDFIIVGRRHNMESPQISGLAEWSEFPELGIIGGLLASSDLNSTPSFFVVQQHGTIT